MRQDAVIRRIQIIGEAVRHLSHELLSTMPDFPAMEARGMRNILVHDYEGVNIGRVLDMQLKIFLFCERLLRNICKLTFSLKWDLGLVRK